MDSIHRTVPRSAQKAAQRTPQRASALSPPSLSPSQPRHRPRASDSPESSAFDSSRAPWVRGIRADKLTMTPKAEPLTTPLSTTPVIKVDHVRNTHTKRLLQHKDATDSTRIFNSACSTAQMAVRWVNYPGRDAIAVSASSDTHLNHLSVFAVWIDASGQLKSEPRRTVAHDGAVAALASSGMDGLLVSASTHGVISVLNDVEEGDLTPIASTQIDAAAPEGAVDLCILDSQVCVAGERGCLYVFPIDQPSDSTDPSFREKTTETTLRAVTAVDVASPLVATGGANGVSIWDLRSRYQVTRLTASDRRCMSAVTTDASQPHFILSGDVSGTVYTWDRRMVSELASEPICTARIHRGPVWDMCIANAGRPGRLLTCGEDGVVSLADFYQARLRGVENGWNSTGDFWSAPLDDVDLFNLNGSSHVSLGINSIDSHFSAELFAYASDTAIVGFGKLSDV